MPETAKLLIPLAAVVIGWLLSELGHRLRGRSAAKAAVGRALSELLEIRHYIKAIDLVFRELRDRLPFPPAEVLRGMVWIQNFMPADPTLPERFAAAVSDIAATHPLLAFKLRSKDQIPVYLTKLRALQLPESSGHPLQREIDELVSCSLIDTIEDSVRELAFSHSLYTWWRVRRLLRSELTVPDEYKAILDVHLSQPQMPAGPEPAGSAPPGVSSLGSPA